MSKKPKTGRPKINCLKRINVTLTDQDRKFLESLGEGAGIVAGIRQAIRSIKHWQAKGKR